MIANGVKYTFNEHIIHKQNIIEKELLEDFENGNYTIDSPLIKVNPYLINPLSALVLFKTDEEEAMVVKIIGKTKEADISFTTKKTKEHIISIVGLYSGITNHVEIYPYQRPTKKVTYKIETEEIPHLNIVDEMKTNHQYLYDELIFLTPAVADYTIGVDYAGDVRFALNVPMTWGIRKLSNGNLLMGTDRLMKLPYYLTGLYEFDFVGKIYKEYRVPNGYHHDEVSLPDNKIIALTCDWENNLDEDTASVIDLDSGEIERVLDFKSFVEPGAQKARSYKDYDWFHGNSVWFDEKTNSLTYSSRHTNAIYNVDINSEELNWILSDPEGWPEEYHKFLFKPVDIDETGFRWSYEQHSALITPLGDVMCFDNHHSGSNNPVHYKDRRDKFSRGVKYSIDTEEMTVQQVYAYGEEEGTGLFSPYIGNVHYYNEDHYMIHFGGVSFDEEGLPSKTNGPMALAKEPNTKLKSYTVEIKNDKKMLELTTKSNYYRAHKMTLYDNKYKDFRFIDGELLGSLGETKQTKDDVVANETKDNVPAQYFIEITEEVDRLVFEGDFSGDDEVYLVLVGQNEVRKYKVDTNYVPRGETITRKRFPDKSYFCVSKGGLEAPYSLEVNVNGISYKTGVTINA